MFKTKVTFLDGRLLSIQSEQFKKYSKSSDWKKAGPPKSHFCFDHVNRLYVDSSKQAIYMMLICSPP